MDVILIKDVDRLGKAGDEKRVKDGFARNFLIPQNLALPATKSTRARMEGLRAGKRQQAQALKEKAEELLSQITQAACVIPMPVGDQGKMHGAVTTSDLLERLKDKGIPLEKHHILLPQPITELGTHEVLVKLHPEVTGFLKVQITRK